VVLGFKNSPLSIGGGYQRGPHLREINIDGENEIITDNVWRFNFFIAVDIPLLNFRTR
jgi:hypothetical protein